MYKVQPKVKVNLIYRWTLLGKRDNSPYFICIGLYMYSSFHFIFPHFTTSSFHFISKYIILIEFLFPKDWNGEKKLKLVSNTHPHFSHALRVSLRTNTIYFPFLTFSYLRTNNCTLLYKVLYAISPHSKSSPQDRTHFIFFPPFQVSHFDFSYFHFKGKRRKFHFRLNPFFFFFFSRFLPHSRLIFLDMDERDRI